MSSENHRIFDHDLAQAAKPDGLDGGQVEPINDPAKSLNRGLITLYKRHLALIHNKRVRGQIDRERADELSANILSIVEKDGLGNEIGYTSTKRAQEIMGPNLFIIPEKIRNAGLEIREEIPPIPFNPDELERAKELGQMLIYRIGTTVEGLIEAIGPIFEDPDSRKVLSNSNWLKEPAFNKIEKIQPGWALVSNKLTPGSTDKTYLEQSEFLAEYLVNEIFKGRTLPSQYQDAIDELNSQKESIRPLTVSSDLDELEKASEMLVELRINQLFRQSPGEVIYDRLVYIQNTDDRLHCSGSVWTNAQYSKSSLLTSGVAFKDSAYFDEFEPNFTSPDLGVAFCRRGADF